MPATLRQNSPEGGKGEDGFRTRRTRFASPKKGAMTRKAAVDITSFALNNMEDGWLYMGMALVRWSKIGQEKTEHKSYT